ncbi:MAG: alkaline phosphatase family protein [Brevibacterium aurantiacum]|uniref:alkaline phosphatase family protein n=1 Tax=Brevibacterium aurantiacum TaxID=273384 RepID=UPI003F8E4284
MTRRSFLKHATAATAVAGGGLLSQPLLPPSLLRQLAEAGPAGSIDDIEHVIFLMQENRSFDHYYGTLRGIQGFDDKTVLPQRSGGTVFEQQDGDDTVLPFSIRQAAGRQSMNAENVDALNHDWEGGTAALNDGWCDNWIPAKTATTMAYYDREDLPFQYELADAFTVCDQYFCSVPTSTSPNRNYFFSGYTGYEPDAPSERAVDNRAYDEGHCGYEWPCLAEILTDAGIDWQVYQEWDNFTDNNLEYFRFTKNVSEQVFSGFSDMGEKFYAELQEAEDDGDSEKIEELNATLSKKLGALSNEDRRIFDRALYRSEPGTLTDRLADDIANGTLPPVSWLVPPSWESEHPSGSSPRAAANLIYRVLDALGNNPEMWRKTALIITFGENDGYFDHVAPPRPPKSETDEWYQGTALGFGNRVPTVIVSPWTVGGYRCSEVFDHTSASQFLEKWKGIAVNKMSAWRRRISGDLTSAFDFTNPRTFSPVGRPEPSEELEPRWLPEPPSESAMPSQEPGTRPQRPLPYQVSVSATPLQDNHAVRLRLKNQGPATANLLVFPFHDSDGAVTGHDVLGEVVVDVPVATENGRYDITVTGPAGFREDVRGSLKDTGSGAEEGSTAGSVTGSVVGSR